MEKLTETKVLKKAKENLFLLLVISGVLLWLPTQRPYTSGDWMVTIGLIALMLVTDGYKSARYLLDKTYLKRYLVKRNDERTIYVEHLAFRKLVQVLSYSYVALSGLLIGYFAERLPSEQLGLLTYGLLGFGLFSVLVFTLGKWHYGRRF